MGDCYAQKVQKYGFSDRWYDSAIVACNNSISIDPNLAEGYKALGLVQFSKGWLKQALETNKKAVKLNPNYWPAVGNTGVCYEYLGNLSEAVQWYKKQNQLNPTGGFGYMSLARVYMLLLDYDSAEKYLNIALNVQPDLLITFETYCQVHLNQGKYIDMIKDVNKIMAISMDDPLALIYSSIAYLNLNNSEKAEEYLSKIPSNSIFHIDADIYSAFIKKKKNKEGEANILLVNAEKGLQKFISKGDQYPPDIVKMSFIEFIRNNKNEGYNWLNKAVNYGFRNYNELLNDPITKVLQNEKQFKNIIQNIKEKVKEQQDILASMKN